MKAPGNQPPSVALPKTQDAITSCLLNLDSPGYLYRVRCEEAQDVGVGVWGRRGGGGTESKKEVRVRGPMLMGLRGEEGKLGTLGLGVSKELSDQMAQHALESRVASSTGTMLHPGGRTQIGSISLKQKMQVACESMVLEHLDDLSNYYHSPSGSLRNPRLRNP